MAQRGVGSAVVGIVGMASNADEGHQLLQTRFLCVDLFLAYPAYEAEVAFSK